MKTLGGFQFTYNAVSQDYCFIESINSLLHCCDQVSVLDAGSSDNTIDFLKLHFGDNPKVILTFLDGTEWKEQQGREKLSYFQNKAMSYLTTDYQILVQSDEVLHEHSLPWIKQAMLKGPELDGWMVKRHNLWRDAYSMLNVSQDRKPCSTEVIRFTKRGCESVDDGESLRAQVSFELIDKIEIYHCGYVRNPYIMKAKVTHMLESVFLTPADDKLKLSDKYEWDHYFSAEDLIPIPKRLPRFVQQWAEERHGPQSLQ